MWPSWPLRIGTTLSWLIDTSPACLSKTSLSHLCRASSFQSWRGAHFQDPKSSMRITMLLPCRARSLSLHDIDGGGLGIVSNIQEALNADVSDCTDPDAGIAPLQPAVYKLSLLLWCDNISAKVPLLNAFRRRPIFCCNWYRARGRSQVCNGVSWTRARCTTIKIV